MTIPRILQFVIQKEPEGGYSASAIGYPVFTQGESLDETVHNIQEAVECHFEDSDTVAPPIMVNFEVPALV